MEKGTVKFFNGEKGFGFIKPTDGSDDIFVHITNVNSSDPLFENDKVEYDIGAGKKGPCATNVYVVNQ